MTLPTPTPPTPTTPTPTPPDQRTAEKRAHLLFAVGTLFVYGVALTAFLTIVQDDLPATFEVLIGLAMIVAIGRNRAKHPRPAQFDPWTAVTLFTIAFVLAGCARWTNNRSELATVVLALVAFLAVGDAILECRNAHSAPRVGWWIAGVGGAFGLLGVVLGRPWLILVSFGIAPAAISLVTSRFRDERTASEPIDGDSIDQEQRQRRLADDRLIRQLHKPRWVRILFVLAAVVTGATLLSWAFSWAFLYAAGVGLVVFALIQFVIANNNADVLMIALVVAFSWALQPRTAPDPAAHLPATGPGILAIGDSYQSGEGSPVYIEGTNQSGLAKQLDNKCRRAPAAYPVLLASGLSGRPPQRLIFLSCSGAVAANVLTANQYEGEGSPIKAVQGSDQKWRARGPSQLELASNAGDVSTLLVMIGGNDIGFSDLVRYCLGPTNCASKAAVTFANNSLYAYRELLAKTDLFGKLSKEFPAANRVLVPYPVPVAEQRCMWSPMTTDEHQAVIEIVTKLNQVNRAAAERAGFSTAPTQSAFRALTHNGVPLSNGDRRICGDKNLGSAINLFALNPQSNPLAQVAFPKNWFHNSVHPTPLGHRLIADRLFGLVGKCGKTLVDPVCAEPQLTAPIACTASCAEAPTSIADLGDREYFWFFLKLLAGLLSITAAALLTHQKIARFGEALLRAVRASRAQPTG